MFGCESVKIEYIIFSLLMDMYIFLMLMALNNTLYFIVIYRSYPQIDILFEFLKKQEEPTVVAAAYSAIICGLVKHFNVRLFLNQII